MLSWACSCVFSLPMIFIHREAELPDGSTQCLIYRLTAKWHWQVRARIHTPTHVYTHTHTPTHTHTHTQTHRHTHTGRLHPVPSDTGRSVVHAYTPTHTPAYTDTYTHPPTHPHTHTHTHTHTQWKGALFHAVHPSRLINKHTHAHAHTHGPDGSREPLIPLNASSTSARTHAVLTVCLSVCPMLLFDTTVHPLPVKRNTHAHHLISACPYQHMSISVCNA